VVSCSFDPACGFLHAYAQEAPRFPPVTPEGVVRLQPTLAAVVAQKAALPQQVS
jgi:hypothetical protein